MRTPRIPDIWQNLRPGEQFHSRLPFHRLQAMAAQPQLADRTFTFHPSATGYFVKCEGMPAEPAPPGTTIN